MEVSCLQENLNKGLTITSRLITGKAQLPILGNILLATEEGRLRLSATNLEMGINLWLGAKVEKEGKITVPARIFTEFIASLPAEKVELSLSENILKVSCLSFEASFNTLSAAEFPAIPDSLAKPAILLPAEVFSAAVSCVAFAAAQDEGRPTLTGVKWIKGEKSLKMAATDGYRLSVKSLPLAGSLTEDLILPAKSLIEAARIAQDAGEGEEIKMGVTPESNQAIFAWENAVLATRLIEGQFPSFEKIIPPSFLTRLVLEKETLVKSVKIASLFARDSANVIKWKIEKGTLQISANSPQVGENVSTLEAKVEGEDNEIAFNSRYLLDFLQAVSADELIFEMTGPLNPGVFKPVGDDSYLHLIMPVRVQG